MIFTNQSYLEIEIDTKIDLSAATVTKILYQKPDRTTGSWDASVRNSKYLYYTFTINDTLNQEGDWLIEPYIEVNGKKAPGDIVKITVSKPLVVL